MGGFSWCGIQGYFGDSHTRYVLDLGGLAFLVCEMEGEGGGRGKRTLGKGGFVCIDNASVTALNLTTKI